MFIWYYLGIILIGIVPVVIKIINYYVEPGFPWHTYITTFIGLWINLFIFLYIIYIYIIVFWFAGYYSAFAILLLVPIDIASVVINRRSTTTGHDSNYSDNIKVLGTKQWIRFSYIAEVLFIHTSNNIQTLYIHIHIKISTFDNL